MTKDTTCAIVRQMKHPKPKKEPAPAPKPLYPMRINKYLAQENVTTRRGADELIDKKKVFINGKVAVLGDKVNEGDEVEVKHTGKMQEYFYYAYNKPMGVITHSPQKGEKDIKGSSNLQGVSPVGRLDKNSHGLIILSNDGRITDKMLNPEYEHDKEYIVVARNNLRDSFKASMEKGLRIGDYQTRPCKIRIIGDRTFAITLTEGKKHQIRRMVEVMHNEVIDLKRIRIMNIKLGTLPSNSYRKIEGDELEELKKTLFEQRLN